jgi:hypothetical protein
MAVSKFSTRRSCDSLLVAAFLLVELLYQLLLPFCHLPANRKVFEIIRLFCLRQKKKEQSSKLKIEATICWRKDIRWNFDIEVDILIPKRRGISHLYSCKHRNVNSVNYYTNTNLKKNSICYLLARITLNSCKGKLIAELI